MRICPKCRAYSADPQLAFCPADGTPLANVGPQSDKFKEGSRVIEEQTKRLSKRSRRLRWRKIALVSMTTLVMTMVVTTSFTVETTPAPPDIPPISSSSPSSSVTPFPSPSSSVSPSSSPSPSASPSPSPSATVVYRISGRVIDPSHSLAGTSAQIVLDGSKHASMTIEANGNYSFSNLPEGGNYTVTAIAPVNFTTPKLSFAKLSRNETADFTVVGFKISGRLMSWHGPLGETKVLIQGSKSASVNTDPNGYYIFADLRAGGSYLIIPQAERLRGASRKFDNLRRDETADFVESDATPPPPECSEEDMERQKPQIVRDNTKAWTELIRRALIKEHVPPGFPNPESTVKPKFSVTFTKPCEQIEVTATYLWELLWTENSRTTRIPDKRNEKEQRTFRCYKVSGTWVCRL